MGTKQDTAEAPADAGEAIDAAAAAAADAAAADAGSEGETEAGAAAAPSLEDVLLAEAMQTRIAELEKSLDAANAEVLAMSDKLASQSTELAAAKAEVERLTPLAGSGGAVVPAPAPAADLPVTSFKLPKPGKTIKLPEDDKRAKGADVAGHLSIGGLLALVLTDSSGTVQPFPAQVVGPDSFVVRGAEGAVTLLFSPTLDITANMPPCQVRHAVLVAPDGTLLSAGRFGADLIGGGGFAAQVPGNNIVFTFS